jgi:hypothetical protein
MRDAARTVGDGWRVPPNPVPLDTSDADVAWVTPRRVMQPLMTFEQPLHLTGDGERIPKAYIYCARPSPGDVFRQFAERARSETGWRYFEIDASHSPHVTAPTSLATLLDTIAALHVK